MTTDIKVIGREPTEAMLRAALDSDSGFKLSTPLEELYVNIFKAMYDAAPAINKRENNALREELASNRQAYRLKIEALEELLAEKDAALAVCVGALRMLENSDCRAIGKIDKCAHGKYGYEDCETCFSDFACTVLTSLPQSTKQDGK